MWKRLDITSPIPAEVIKIKVRLAGISSRFIVFRELRPDGQQTSQHDWWLNPGEFFVLNVLASDLFGRAKPEADCFQLQLWLFENV